MKNNHWTNTDIPNQKGKNVLITGANSGLGFEAAILLCQNGANVIMAVRNPDKGKEAIIKIQKTCPNAYIDLMQVDLSDLNSIHCFAKDFCTKYKRLDILLNNAGIMWPPKREETRQGFEAQFGINHLGHFALTGLLMDLIKKTPDSRIITQSSIAHRMNARIHFSDLNWGKKYNKTKAYAQSKLANLLFSYELDRLLKENKIKTISLAAHPGISSTNLFRSAGFFSRFFTPMISQEADKGALPMLRAATEEGLKGGEFYGPGGILRFRGYPVLQKSSRKSHNPTLAKNLWLISEQLTGVYFDFTQS